MRIANFLSIGSCLQFVVGCTTPDNTAYCEELLIPKSHTSGWSPSCSTPTV
jgi:hypothetical protein